MRKSILLAVVLSFIGRVAWIGTTFAADGQTTVRIHGAATLNKMITSKAAEIGAKSNVKIESVGNSSGRGLEDLLAGRADVAAIGGPLAGVAAAVNAKTPGAVKIDALKEFTVLTVDLTFIVHASNTVPSLTPDQAKDLLTGKTKNWKDVGGPDVPVVVVAPQPLDGSRVTIQQELLKDASYAPDTRVMQVAPDVVKVVAQIPGAISVVSVAHVTPGVKSVKMDKTYLMPMSLITNGEPKEPVKGVIATIQSMLGTSATATAK